MSQPESVRRWMAGLELEQRETAPPCACGPDRQPRYRLEGTDRSVLRCDRCGRKTTERKP